MSSIWDCRCGIWSSCSYLIRTRYTKVRDNRAETDFDLAGRNSFLLRFLFGTVISTKFAVRWDPVCNPKPQTTRSCLSCRFLLQLTRWACSCEVRDTHVVACVAMRSSSRVKHGKWFEQMGKRG
ncbi:hypothetical protein CaCOL14_011498 [Colletotrichum acutatum]